MAITNARMVFWICSRNDNFSLIPLTDSTLKVSRNVATDSLNTITANNPITSDIEDWYCKSFISPDNFYYDANNIFPFGIGYNYYTSQNNPIEIQSNIDTSKVFIVDCVGVSSLTNVTATFPNFFLPTASTNTKYYLLPTQNTWINTSFNQIDTNKFKYWVDGLASVISNPQNALRFYIIGHFESVSHNYRVIDNISNCTKDNPTTEIEPDSSYTVTLTANNGYGFSSNNLPYIEMDNTRYDGVLNNDGSVTISIEYVTANITIYAVAVAAYSLTLDIYNCVLYNGNTPYEFDYILDGETYNFILQANNGFTFKTFPQWTMGSDTGSFALFPNDKTKAEIRWNLYPYITISNNLTIQANATLSASLKYGFVSIYNPTYDEVDELSKKRFYDIGQSEYKDLSQYIISFRKLYVDIQQITRELVYFGSYNTNVSSNVITTNFIETDCGVITIDEYNENSLDYNGVEIELYLPFVGSVSLNPNQVYGKQLHLVYRTNPLNGDCVAILFSNNTQVAYSQGNVSFDVPINFKYGNLNNYGTNDNALYMAELQPYIEIKTNRQYQNMNSRLLNNNLWVQISDCSGYVMFGDIELHPINKINKDEYDELISLLQSGIIV